MSAYFRLKNPLPKIATLYIRNKQEDLVGVQHYVQVLNLYFIPEVIALFNYS